MEVKYLHVGGLSQASKKEAAPGRSAKDNYPAATLHRTCSTQLFEMPDRLVLELFVEACVGQKYKEKQRADL